MPEALRTPPGQPAVRFKFENKWTASVIIHSPGAACAAWLTAKTLNVKEKDIIIGPDGPEVTDDQVIEFVDMIRRK